MNLYNAAVFPKNYTTFIIDYSITRVKDSIRKGDFVSFSPYITVTKSVGAGFGKVASFERGVVDFDVSSPVHIIAVDAS